MYISRRAPQTFRSLASIRLPLRTSLAYRQIHISRANMEDSKIKQPEWSKPKAGSEVPKLQLYNSLTREKTDFVPMDPFKISWYSCGPTVYDSSHMGHARNYVTIDINRRIMSDYFGYNIFFVQNVTDIDDKIIVRARQTYLFDKYSATFDSTQAPVKELVEKATEATTKYIASSLPEGATKVSSISELAAWEKSVNVPELSAVNPKLPMHLTAIKAALGVIEKAKSVSTSEFLEATRSVLVPVLDSEEGATVTDPAVFRGLAAYWEEQFDNDMALLNVLPPTVTTRVSEYVPEIIAFVEKIIRNKFAYVTVDGSVYFDTVNFEKDGDHYYAKLQPWNKGKQDLIDDGEGSLSTKLEGKKSNNDFALWKASKPGEPSWESPWGQGRPGWHIECSVMASEILGPQLDIHSGGIDLAFPHHDNELAQAEACHGNQQWVNYFLHTGHLHIEGQKMSKSLKNFITIREALERYTPRQLRLSFAMQQWNNNFDFKSSLSEVKSFESAATNFFHNVQALVRDLDGQRTSKKAGQEELALYEAIGETRVAVHNAFADNLSVPVAIQAINQLVQKCNVYITKQGGDVRVEVLVEAAKYITSIFSLIGLSTNANGLGWTDGSSDADSQGASREEVLLPAVKILSTFRDNVRSSAKEKAPYSKFLTSTDALRDQVLLDLSVSLDDRSDGHGALIKFLDASTQKELIEQRDQKLKNEQERLARKAEQERVEAERLAKRLEQAKIAPEDLFKSLPEYGSFDDKGVPLTDKAGEPLSKSLLKKLTKQYENQKKLHQEYLSKQ